MNHRQKLVQQQFLNNEEAVIKRLNQVYRKSLSDVEDKIKNLQFDIGRLQAEYDWLDPKDPEAEKIKSQIQSKIYQKQYQEQLQRQLDGILNQMQKDQYLTVSQYLDGCYTDGFVGSIFDLSGQGVPLMMPINQESMIHAVQLDSKISKGLYTRLGEDVDLLKKKITAQISRSIATGETFAQTAKQLAGYTSIGYNNAIRIARTEGHRIQTTAQMDAMQGAKDRGADLVKQWDAALDARTRDSHVKVDGEIKEINERFSNGLRYPGDPHGAAAEVINCRCALLQRARWALADGFTKMDGFSGEIKSFDSMETYDEFKEAYFSPENRAYMKYVGELEKAYGTKDFNKILGKMSDDEYKIFTDLEKARPQFSGMYRGDDVVKNSTISLTNSTKNDILDSAEGQLKPFTKVNVEDIPSMDETRFQAIKEGLEKNGIAVIQDAEGDAYLLHMGAEAMTLSDGSAVIFQSGQTPSASAVFEEIIHTTQIKKLGAIESTGDIQEAIEYYSREIEANEKLLKYQNAYGLTNKDVESVQENLEIHYKNLEKVKSNV